MPFGQIQWARQTIEGRQTEAQGGRLLNLYAVNPDPQSKVASLLYHAPGKRKWASHISGAAINGMLASDSPVYGKRLSIVSGAFFYQIRLGRGGPGDMDVNYSPQYTENEVVFEPQEINIRPLPAGFQEYGDNEVCRMATDGRRVLFVQRREVALFDANVVNNTDGGLAAGGFRSVRAPIPADQGANLPDEEWVDVAWIDGYFFLAARSGELFHSILESGEFDQIDFTSASSNPDPITALAVYNRRLFVMGAETVEIWYNTGNPISFAFSRDNSFVANVGCIATATAYQDEAGIYFVGHDKSVYGNLSGQFKVLSNEMVDYDLARCDITKCRAYGYVEEGHRFYSITLFILPTRLEANERPVAADIPPDGFVRKNWTLDIQTGLWDERSETGILCADQFNSVNLVGTGDGTQESIWNQSLRWGDNNFKPVQRIATTPSLYAGQQRVMCYSFEIDLPIRSAEGLGRSINPDQVKLTWSDDSFSTERGLDDTTNPPRLLTDNRPARMKWTQLGQFRAGRNFKLEFNSPRPVVILGGYVRTNIQREGI